MLWFLFLLILIAQEFAILYCAFKLLSECGHEGSKRSHSGLRAALPDFAKVKILPDPASVYREPAYNGCKPNMDLKSCRKRMVRNSMAARA